MGNALKDFSTLSTSKIFRHFISDPTPFPVRTDIEAQYNLIIDGACLIYVTVRAVSADYADK